MTCLIRASGSLVPVISVAEISGQRDVFPDATLNENDQSTFLLRIQEILVNSTKRRDVGSVQYCNRDESRRVRRREGQRQSIGHPKG